MTLPLDYERLGRQIALAELGVNGQRALAARPVRFVGDPFACADAERLWTHAGGVVASSVDDPSALVVSIDSIPNDPIAALGCAAWAALEAATALLQRPAASRPPSLLAALHVAPHSVTDP